MSRILLVLTAAACFAGCGGSSKASAGPSLRGMDGALDAFQRGNYEEADALLSRDASLEAAFLRGRLLLLRNRNLEAARVLAPLDRKAKKFSEFDLIGQAHLFLARAHLRSDDYLKASKYFALSGDRVLARKYQVLASAVGYLTDSRWKESRVSLLATDPVPVVRMTVNGLAARFIVDTGMDEILLDRTFASRVKAKGFGVRVRGYQRNYDEAIVDEIRLGSLRVRNVPVQIGRLTPIAAVKAAGAIGLGFLMRFDFTLDFKRGRLVLRRPQEKFTGQTALLGGDNYLLVPGKLNGSIQTHVAVHTGLAGVTVAASENFLQVLGQELSELQVGPLRLVNPPVDVPSFPTGLEASYAVPVGFVLGPAALRGRSIRLDPRTMTFRLE